MPADDVRVSIDQIRKVIHNLKIPVPVTRLINRVESTFIY